MKSKTIEIPEDCIGCVVAALRTAVTYKQSYRLDAKRKGYKQASEALMEDVANLTMIADRIEETRLS